LRSIEATVAAYCCLMMATSTVHSFSPTCTYFRKPQTLTKRHLFEEYMSEDYDPTPGKKQNKNDDEINYGMGGVDLSKRWTELVAGGHVTATTKLNSEGENDEELRVRYGVRLEEGADQQSNHQRLLEFAEILPNEKGNVDSTLNEHVASINSTLSEMQQKSSFAIDCIYDGPYSIQLQLVRTLRPPRSAAMSSDSKDEKSSCEPPPYDSSKDSFLVGPLRLFGRGEFHGEGEPRERAAQLFVPRDAADADSSSNRVPWDVFHNISPVDPRGHFLLLPDLGDENQWRDQSLNSDDCYDLTYLASTIEPLGSMVLSFNSVGAGASQNHVHAHAWLNPPPPLLYRDDPTAEYDSVYAVTKGTSLASHELAHGVSVSLVKYPCTCVKLSAIYEEGAQPTLKEMGAALSKIVGVAQKMEVTHNVVWTTSAAPNGEQIIDAYIFFRKAETLEVDGETFRLGASEMMGVFHASSKEQLISVKTYKGLSCWGTVNILSDASYEPREYVWAEVSSTLGKGKASRRLQALQKAELYKKEKTASEIDNEATSSSRYVRTGVPYFDDEDKTH